jgi:hypothetical protein
MNRDEVSRLIREKVELETVRIRKEAQERTGSPPSDLIQEIGNLAKFAITAQLKRAGMTVEHVQFDRSYGIGPHSLHVKISLLPHSKIGKRYASFSMARDSADKDASGRIFKMKSEATRLRTRLQFEKPQAVEAEVKAFLTTAH